MICDCTNIESNHTHCIIETDLGHDPDDFFTICWLAALGIKIDAIVITPGDIDQIAIANFLKKELSLDCPIGVSKLDRDKYSSGGLHYDLLKKYGLYGNLRKSQHKHDGLGKEVLFNTLTDQDILIIGPASNIGDHLKECGDIGINDITFQGGFLPYKYFEPDIRLDKFENIEAIGSFNMNGNIKAAQEIINRKAWTKRFIGKHICHTVKFTENEYIELETNNSRGADLFIEAMDILFAYNKNKKMHDLVAAACMIYPYLGNYLKCDIIHVKGGWTSIPNNQSDCLVITQLERDEFWERVVQFK